MTFFSQTAADEPGFTLVELIVVMTLISLTAFFALPKIRSSLSSDDLTSAVRRFVGLAAEAAQEARMRRTAVVLRLDGSQHAFVAATASASDGDEDPKKMHREVKLPESVQIADISFSRRKEDGSGPHDVAIMFDARGSTDKTAVHFRHEDGEELTVILSPFLGSAKILDGYVSLEEDRIVLGQ